MNTYQRTTRSRNKMNQRAHRPVELLSGAYVTLDGRRYVVAPDGARVRVKKEGER